MISTRGHRSEVQGNARSITSRGFTLIELLVVVAIIGILVGIMLPAIGGVKIKAQIKKAEADVKALASACRAYHVEYGYWPGDPANRGVNSFWTANNNVVINQLIARGNDRKINFIESVPDQTWVDPFRSNMPYRISISVDDDSVRVWSCGPNGVDDDGFFKPKDTPPKDDIEVKN